MYLEDASERLMLAVHIYGIVLQVIARYGDDGEEVYTITMFMLIKLLVMF